MLIGVSEAGAFAVIMGSMTPEPVRRALLNIRSGGQQLKVDILRSGLVRLTVTGRGGGELLCETLEDLLLDAAASPLLGQEPYEQLCWELDMMALRGDGNH